MCLRRSGFRIAARDVLLGVVEGCPFYVGAAQFPYWANCQLTLDVTPDGGDSFSLEAAGRRALPGPLAAVQRRRT